MKTKILFLLFIMMMGIGESYGQRKKNQNTTFEEDLSTWTPPGIEKEKTQKPIRPHIQPQYSVTNYVNEILDTIDFFYRTKKFVDGYKLQIYSGQDRNEATLIYDKLQQLFPTIPSSMEFVQPKFRVVAGEYYTDLQAHRDLYHVREIFPNTILVPNKILLKK